MVDGIREDGIKIAFNPAVELSYLTINEQDLPLSAEVLAHTNTIRKYAKESDIEKYVPLIQAVMMQESGGKGNDPMQASECEFNTKYPKQPNGIQEVDYSIQVGVMSWLVVW